jgi:hypothetical protein
LSQKKKKQSQRRQGFEGSFRVCTMRMTSA